VKNYHPYKCTILALIYLPSALVAGLALSITCSAYQNHSTACKQERWQSIAGQITRLNIEEIAVKDRSMTHTHYQPSIYYEYTVQGLKHAGSFRPPIANDIEQQAAKDYLAKFHVGGAQNVYFDPERPGDSVLARQSKSQQFNLLWQSAAVFVLALCSFIWSAGKELEKFSPVPLGHRKRSA